MGIDKAQKIAEELLKLTEKEKILLLVKLSNKCKELMQENEKLKSDLSVAQSKIEELESKVAYCEN